MIFDTFHFHPLLPKDILNSGVLVRDFFKAIFKVTSSNKLIIQAIRIWTEGRRKYYFRDYSISIKFIWQRMRKCLCFVFQNMQMKESAVPIWLQTHKNMFLLSWKDSYCESLCRICILTVIKISIKKGVFQEGMMTRQSRGWWQLLASFTLVEGILFLFKDSTLIIMMIKCR